MTALDDAALTAFLDLTFDFACTRHVRELVDPDRVLAGVDAAFTPERVALWQTRWLHPQRARLIERFARSTLPLSVWLPAPVRDGLAQLLGAPVRLPRKAVDEAVASENVRDSVRTMLTDTLTTFLKTATEGGAGGGGALGAAVGWGARAFGAAGKNLLGGLGEGVQRALQDRVRDFVDTSVAAVQKKIADRIASDETARSLGKRRRGAFEKFMAQTEADAAKTMMRQPYDKIDPAVPGVIAHNLARAEVRTLILDEVRAAVEELSTQTIGELLDTMGLRAQARAAVHAHGLPLARAWVATPTFAAWWSTATA